MNHLFIPLQNFKYSHDVKATSMLYPIREKAGLGSPPEPYYTNEFESKNNILKQHVNRKSSSLPEFVDKMKEMLIEQRSEIEKAVASLVSIVFYHNTGIL